MHNEPLSTVSDLMLMRDSWWAPRELLDGDWSPENLPCEERVGIFSPIPQPSRREEKLEIISHQLPVI